MRRATIAGSKAGSSDRDGARRRKSSTSARALARASASSAARKWRSQEKPVSERRQPATAASSAKGERPLRLDDFAGEGEIARVDLVGDGRVGGANVLRRD